MSQGFSGEPKTRWIGNRNMILLEDFYYIDSNGRRWDAPQGSSINGATIPQPLWSTIGSPYVGCYRRASIVHDVGVGELDNPPVTHEQRKAADRMFYDACLYDGCGESFAWTLYIGVRLGTWSSLLSLPFFQATSGKKIAGSKIRDISELKTLQDVPGLGLVRESSEAEYIRMKFWEILDDPYARNAFDQKSRNDGLDLLDQVIDSRTSGIGGAVLENLDL